jgi:uncharacterized protein (UPF0548 family)
MVLDCASMTAPAELTYPEVGRTAGTLPDGYHHLRRSATIGTGAETFADAADKLMRWQVQKGAGMDVDASSDVAVPGALVKTTVRFGPARFVAPCRVVYVIDESRRKGFAYGTLPGHPESGEEAFIVTHEPDDTVTLTIIAFSRPATLVAKAGGPFGWMVQELVTRRYLRALASQ